MKNLFFCCFCAILTLSSCVSPRMGAGALPDSANCVLVMPFEIQAASEYQKEFFSEFLSLDLMNMGLKGVLDPRELAKIYHDQGMELPKHWTNEWVIDISHSVGVPYVLFGYVSNLTMMRSGSVGFDEAEIGVDIYLMDTSAKEIRWFYHSRDLIHGTNVVDYFGKLSQKIVLHLMRRKEFSNSKRQEICWTNPKKDIRLAMRKTSELTKRDELPKEIKDYLENQRKGLVLKADAFEGRSDVMTKLAIAALHQFSNTAKYILPSELVVVESHIDSSVNATDDLKRSQERAEVIKKHLIKLGVQPHSIQITSHGSTLPKAPNVSSKGRELNRRIEIRLKSKKQ